MTEAQVPDEQAEQNEGAEATREQLEFVHIKHRAWTRLVREYEQAKLQADAAKKAMEVAQGEFNAAGEEQDPPLLDVGEKDADRDGWRNLPISELGAHGVAEGTVTLLAKANILTLGDYCDYCNTHVDGPRAISGVGQGKADGISDAWDKFFESHKEYCQPEAEDTNAGEDEVDDED